MLRGVLEWGIGMRLYKLCVYLYLSLFCVLFFKQREYDAANVVFKLTKIFSTLKRDFGEFLSLKGVLNIPMIRYPSSHYAVTVHGSRGLTHHSYKVSVVSLLRHCVYSIYVHCMYCQWVGVKMAVEFS